MQDILQNRNMIKSGRGVDMGDGWETARNPTRPAVLEADDNGILQVLVFIRMDGRWMRMMMMTRKAGNNRIAFRLNTTLAKVQELAAIALHAFWQFFKTLISYW